MTITTTPSFVFELSVSPDNFTDIVISFYQGGVPMLSKHKEDLNWDINTGSLRLTEAETQRLDHGSDCVIAVSMCPDENTNYEAARVQKKVYYFYGPDLKVGFEDETTEVLVNVNEYSGVGTVQVNANVLNALKGTWKAGQGIAINDDTIAVKDDNVWDGDGVDG